MKNLDKRKLFGVIISPIMIGTGILFIFPICTKYYTSLQDSLSSKQIIEIPLALLRSVWIAIWLRFIVAMFREKGSKLQLNVYPLIFAVLLTVLYIVTFEYMSYAYNVNVIFTIIVFSLLLSVEKK